MLLGSRECSYFNSERNVRNGVVVECNWNKSDYIAHTVADFTTHECVYILRTCFKTRENPENRSQFYKDERPYEVFENVNFEADEVNVVHEKVARNQKKWECFNMGNDVFAVKDVCIFSRDAPFLCYSELAGRVVPYNEEISDEVLCPFVPFDCFLQFNFTSSDRVNLDHPVIFPLTYKVHSLEQVNPDRFDLALKTPWLRLNQPVYQEYDPFNTASDPEKEKHLPGIKAYALTGDKVFVPSKPRWCISLAFSKISSLLKVKHRAEIQPHMPLLVDVRYNKNLNRFIIYETSACNGQDLPATVTNAGNHRAHISPVLDCPGYFTLGDLALVFDKYGQLAPYYSALRQTKILVDFNYIDPDERAYTPLEVCSVFVKREVVWKELLFDALYLGNNEFYCQYLHFWILRALDHMDEYSIGSWYQIKIERIYSDEYVADVQARLHPHFDRIPHKMVQGQNEFLFDVDIIFAVDNQMLVVPFIGPIGCTEAELARVQNHTAIAVQFPLADELPEKRPQVRPRMTRMFETIEDGKMVGSYE
uniref:Tudor domain-containing protein n=1 Tax=Panagrolaimus sp. ES5 TaxID=591445 RepID=A0AC34F232_9BILA